MYSLVALALSAVSLILLEHPVVGLLISSGVVRANYRGHAIPTAGGSLLLLASLPGYLVLAYFGEPSLLMSVYPVIAGLSVVAFIGFVDDLSGGTGSKGFAGHLGAAVRAGMVSTGLLKAIFISLTAIVVSLSFSSSIATTLLNAVIIALTTNLINLLDLRPGRALKGFIFFLALASIAFGTRSLQMVTPVIGPAVAILGADLKGEIMLGDTGSNLLGFALGLAIAASGDLPETVIWLIVIVGLNVLSERLSFTRLIESNKVLRFIDELGRPSGRE